MSQITEDLRAAEGTETLDPALRAKLLAATPVPSELGARGRSFPALAWGLGAAVLLAWFAFNPLTASHRTAYMEMRAPSLAATASIGRQMAVPLAVPRPALPETLTRQVHKEAALAVEVTDAEAKSDQVAQMVKGAGGFVASNTLTTGGDGTRRADLTVKVPVVQFEAVLGQIAKLGTVTAKNITGEDITEKTSDADQTEGVLEDDTRRADARLATLGKRAGWRDQQAAQDARIQLAQARARLVLLKKMAALSTLTISLTERPKPPAAPPVTSGFLGGLGDTTRAATGSLLASAGALFALVIWTLAYAPLWLPLALIGRYFYRRSRQTAA